MIQLIAHRGHAREFPENTLLALRSALDLGLRFLEFDVQLAADQIPVVIHDHELARTADLPGRVFDLPAAQLKAIEVNESRRFGTRFQGVGVPLLGEVVELLAQRPAARAFVEIKRASLRHFGAQATVARVLETLKPVRERCVVISFDLLAVELARRGGSEVGWVLADYDGHTRLKCEALEPQWLFCNHLKLPPDGSRLWRGPWRWALYEVDQAPLAHALAARGADAIETMAAAEMIAALGAAADIGPPAGAADPAQAG